MTLLEGLQTIMADSGEDYRTFSTTMVGRRDLQDIPSIAGAFEQYFFYPEENSEHFVFGMPVRPKHA